MVGLNRCIKSDEVYLLGFGFAPPLRLQILQQFVLSHLKSVLPVLPAHWLDFALSVRRRGELF